MCDSFESVFDRMSEVVHRIDAPLCASSVVRKVIDPVDNWISHVEVAGSKIDLRTESHLSVFKFACSHSLKEIKALFDRSVSVRGDSGSLCIASHISHLVRCKLANVSQSFFDELDRKSVHLLEILGSVEESVIPVVS